MCAFGPGLITRHLHQFSSVYNSDAEDFFVGILDLLFPRRCVGCGRIGRYFCESCRAGIRNIADNEAVCLMCGRPAISGATHPRCRTKHTPDGLTSFFRYDKVVRRAITLLKYRSVTDLADEFVSLLPEGSELNRVARSGGVLIPVPMHRSRRKLRGFNQAELLGALIADHLKLPMQTTALVRVRQGMPQVECVTRKKRMANMRNVFRAIRAVPYTHVILFDDVCTTGATLRAAAGELKRNGVQYVWAVTMAR